MVDVKTRSVVVDGLSVETTDQGAQAIDKLQKQIADERTANAAALAAKDVLLADAKKKAEMMEGENAALKKKAEDAAMTPAKLDALVKDRAAVVAVAKAHLGDAAVADKSDAEIRKAVVAKALGDKAKDMSDDAIKGAFDVLAAGVKASDADGMRKSLSDGLQDQDGSAGGWPASVFDRAGVKERGAKAKH